MARLPARLPTMAVAIPASAAAAAIATGSATLHDLQCRLVNQVLPFQILRGMTVRLRNVRDPGLFAAPGFDARFLKEGELWIYAQDPAHRISPEFLITALARGDRCHALVD